MESIDIERLSRDELVALNRRIVERVKQLDQVNRAAKMCSFHVGERVCFRPPDQDWVYGSIVRFNRKTVSVLTDSGLTWKVGPNHLCHAGDRPDHVMGTGPIIDI